MKPDKQVLLYLPVIHAGYEQLLRDHADATEILVMGKSFQLLFPQLKKDIRALEPALVAQMAMQIVPKTPVRVIELDDLAEDKFAKLLVMPDEDIMHGLVAKFDLEHGHEVTFISTFLRWDRSRAEQEKAVAEDEILSQDTLHVMLAGLAKIEAAKSPDWWRQVGAVVWKDGKILYYAYNDHCPTSYSAVIDGDPRSGYRGGIRTDLSLAIHAEASIIGRAAHDGVSLLESTMAVNTFACPTCARLIVSAGISELIFQTGYALLDGDDLLRSAGVKIVRVSP